MRMACTLSPVIMVGIFPGQVCLPPCCMKKRLEENQKKSSCFCKNQMAKPLFSIQSDQKKIIRIEMVIE